MGYANTVRNSTNGKTYSISTVQKFETWESAVFEGTNPLMMGLGRGMRYLEYTFPWDSGAQQTHQALVEMASHRDPQQWQMTKADISEAREVATAFVTKQPKIMLDLIAKDGWRVRKGSAQRPRGYSVPLLIPDSTSHATGEIKPLNRYATDLVALALESAATALENQGKPTVGLVSEFCYFFIQWAQRTAASKLTDAEMRVVIPELVYAVYDVVVERGGLSFESNDEAVDFKTTWINTGADRNETYSGLPISGGSKQGVGGTLFWEAARNIATEASGHDDARRHVMLSLLLPASVQALDVSQLVSAARRRA